MEVARRIPLDLRGAGTFGPVVHQSFGGGCVAWCDFTSSDHRHTFRAFVESGPSIGTARFRCRLLTVDNNSGNNLVWIGMTLLGVVFGLLLFGVVGGVVGGIALFVVGAFATKPKAKPDADKS